MKKLKQVLVILLTIVMSVALVGCGASKYTITKSEDSRTIYRRYCVYYDVNFDGKIGKISTLEPILNEIYENTQSDEFSDKAMMNIEMFATDYSVFIEFNKYNSSMGPFYSGYVEQNGTELTKETKELADLLGKLNAEIGSCVYKREYY